MRRLLLGGLIAVVFAVGLSDLFSYCCVGWCVGWYFCKAI